MEQVTVFNKANFRRLSKTVRLEPGANLVDAKDLEDLKASNAHVRELFDRGILKSGDAPKADKNFVENKAVSDLSELKVSEAVKAIEACKDASQLKRWSETEPRKTVKEALIKRHHQLIDPVDTSKD